MSYKAYYTYSNLLENVIKYEVLNSIILIFLFLRQKFSIYINTHFTQNLTLKVDQLEILYWNVSLPRL